MCCGPVLPARIWARERMAQRDVRDRECRVVDTAVSLCGQRRVGGFFGDDRIPVTGLG